MTNRLPRYAQIEMPRRHPRQNCRICEGHISVVGDLSARGKCDACGELLEQENLRQLREHRGPFFDHYRYRSIAALGAVPLDHAQRAR